MHDVMDEQITRSSTAPRLLEVAGASVAVPDVPEPVSRRYKPTFSHRSVRKDTLRTDHMRKGHGYRIPTTCRFSRHLSTGKSLTCVSSSFLTGLSSDPSHRSVHSFRPGQGGSDPPRDRSLQAGGNETSPCATSEARLARIGARAQAVDEERDHALAVSRSLIRYRHAQVGDGVQEIPGADAGADLAARYRGFKQ